MKVLKMDSPLLEPRPCPSCPGLIAGADPHRLCFECLGPDHAADGLTQSPAFNACRMLPRLCRGHRLEHFQAYYVSPEKAEDQDLEVVEMEEQDVAGEVPFRQVGRPRSSRKKTTTTPRCLVLPVPESRRVRHTGLRVRSFLR